jgi:hypothetical protein
MKLSSYVLKWDDSFSLVSFERSYLIFFSCQPTATSRTRLNAAWSPPETFFRAMSQHQRSSKLKAFIDATKPNKSMNLNYRIRELENYTITPAHRFALA